MHIKMKISVKLAVVFAILFLIASCDMNPSSEIQDEPYINGSVSFDGDGDYGEITYNQDLDLKTNLTIEVAFYIDEFSDSVLYGLNNLTPILSQSHLDSAAGNYLIAVNSNMIFFGFETIDSRYISNFSIEKNTWYHFAIVHTFGDGANTQLFINGNVINGTWYDDIGDLIDGNDMSQTNSEYPIRVGWMDTNNPTYLKGKIDELRFWNIRRTSQEINQNYNSELSEINANLVAYWKFNDSVSGNVTDESNNTHSFELQGNSSIIH